MMPLVDVESRTIPSETYKPIGEPSHRISNIKQSPGGCIFYLFDDLLDARIIGDRFLSMMGDLHSVQLRYHFCRMTHYETLVAIMPMHVPKTRLRKLGFGP